MCKGIQFVDPFSDPQWVFPLLYAYICDHLEGTKLTCTYDTNTCQLPCSICLCVKENLSSMNVNNVIRTK